MIFSELLLVEMLVERCWSKAVGLMVLNSTGLMVMLLEAH